MVLLALLSIFYRTIYRFFLPDCTRLAAHAAAVCVGTSSGLPDDLSVSMSTGRFISFIFSQQSFLSVVPEKGSCKAAAGTRREERFIGLKTCKNIISLSLLFSAFCTLGGITETFSPLIAISSRWYILAPLPCDAVDCRKAAFWLVLALGFYFRQCIYWASFFPCSSSLGSSYFFVFL